METVITFTIIFIARVVTLNVIHIKANVVLNYKYCCHQVFRFYAADKMEEARLLTVATKSIRK
jgi:hypothetical protein